MRVVSNDVVIKAAHSQKAKTPKQKITKHLKALHAPGAASNDHTHYDRATDSTWVNSFNRTGLERGPLHVYKNRQRQEHKLPAPLRFPVAQSKAIAFCAPSDFVCRSIEQTTANAKTLLPAYVVPHEKMPLGPFRTPSIDILQPERKPQNADARQKPDMCSYQNQQV